jgi:Ca2+-binding RTX toxin-like protein
MVKIINIRNSLNCNGLHLLIIINQVLIHLNNKKNLDISTTFTYQLLFCLVGSLFFVFVGIDFIGEQGQLQQQQQEHQYNIINIAWAENINGTENSENITGTKNQDKIKGFGGNDTIAGKEGGDNISGGSGDDIIYGNEGKDIRSYF